MNRLVSIPLLCLLLALCARATPAAGAADRYAAPDGRSSNTGSLQSPWDIASALDGRHKTLQPGDTLYLLPGLYKSPNRQPVAKGFPVKLAGTKDKPITIRPAGQGRVTLDGGLLVQAPSAFLIIRDLELTVSEPIPSSAVKETGTYVETHRPWGGLEVLSADHCQFINLIIHDNSQGVGLWKEAVNCELYGCIIYDNGWAGVARGHGHAVYTQNDRGVKTISNCIMTGGFGYTLHAYGSRRAYVNNYLITQNIVYDANGPFLVGGGRPSHGIRVLNNYLYNADMRLGYAHDPNADLELRGNLVVNGSVRMEKWTDLTQKDNLFLKKADPLPGGLRIFLLPNRYDPARANLVIYDFRPPSARQPTAQIDTKGFLEKGDSYRLMDPKNFFGQPRFTGHCSGKTIQVPLTGEFTLYVVLKNPPAAGHN